VGKLEIEERAEIGDLWKRSVTSLVKCENVVWGGPAGGGGLRASVKSEGCE
jgi:hypothetical protein